MSHDFLFHCYIRIFKTLFKCLSFGFRIIIIPPSFCISILRSIVRFCHWYFVIWNLLHCSIVFALKALKLYNNMYYCVTHLDYGDVFYIVLMIIIDWFHSDDVHLILLIKMVMHVNNNYEFVKVRWLHCSAFVHLCYLYSYRYLVSMF